MSRKRTTEEFIKLAENVHHGKYDYSLVNYTGKDNKVDIICPIHGVFSQKASLHLKGSNCPKCSYIERGFLFRKNKNEFIEEANIVHHNVYNYDNFNYINAHTKGLIFCPKHGFFEQTPNDHLQGKGCQICQSSHLENYVNAKLKSYNINFVYQKRFEWLGRLSLDFYLPDYNIAIECQGKQHIGKGGWTENFDFESLYKRDKLKNKLCEQNGIKLLYFCGDLNDLNHELSLYNNKNTFDLLDNLILTYNIVKRNE